MMDSSFFKFLRRFWVLITVGALLLTATCAFSVGLLLRNRGSNGQTIPLNNQSSNQQSSGVVTSTTGQGGSTTMAGETQPMSLHLSEGQPVPQAVEPVPQVTGEPLNEEEIGQVLGRLPELTEEPGDEQDFRLPEDVLPPPRPGETIEESFPPPDGGQQVAPVDGGPLEVLRFAPEGEIGVAPFINVTFNQPMVPLATLEDLAAQAVPVQVEPALPGTWRWLGTRTLNFQHDSDLIDRLPKATEYRVTVPAGTESATGGVLAEAVTWTFTTPPPQVTTGYPSGEPQSREPLFFVHFDQRIDPAAVLATIRVRSGSQTNSLRLVDEAEVRENEKTARLLENAVEGRWLAFKAAEPLPADTEVTVDIGPGTPSAEGPLTTTEAHSYSFRTYAPLRIEEHGCSWGGNRCQPLTPFFIRFNNPLDESVYDETMVRIEPELPGASVSIMGNTINIQGASKGQTTYTVTVSGQLQDAFGQTLGSDQRLTFRVGPAEPSLYGPGETFITLDPAAPKPVFSVYALNYTTLDLEVYAVQPSDWAAFQSYMRNFQRTDVTVEMPGRRVINETLRIESAADALSEVNIDLERVMDGNFGHFIVKVSPPAKLFANNESRYWQTVHAWVQVTQIGLDAFVDHSEMVAWASALKDGAPLEGVTITAEPGGSQVTTGADGTIRFAIPDGAAYLVARQGADQAMLPKSNYFWGDDAWRQRTVTDSLRWYVFDDRQMYRPGEEVHVKGWIRQVGGKQDGDVELLGSALQRVNYSVTDSQGNEIGAGQAEANALGGFDFALTLPEQVNLGYAYVNLRAEGSLSNLDWREYGHSFQIQEFRRPEFEVVARNETTGPYFSGEHAVVAVNASYYAGGALPNAEVTWQVTSRPGQYAPPNWPEFTFGTWTPWWWFGYRTESDFGPYGPGGTVESFSGTTDAAGEHFLRLDFSPEGEPKPVSVLAEGTVIDVNRQAWTGTTSLLVHPASLYVGMKSDRYFVDRGTPLKIDLIVTDLDGNPVADRQIMVSAARLEWKYRQGEWAEEEVDSQVCQVGSQNEPVNCTFDTPLGGTYRITAQVTDDQDRLNQSQLTRWVSGSELPPAREVEQEKLNLIPDKETYAPGDVAQILVQSPFSPAEGLLTINRSGIVSVERFTITDGTFTLQVPIEEGYIPNLHLQIDVNGAAPRVDDEGNPLPEIAKRPAYASGQITLRIPPVQRTLSLEVTPAQRELEPGGETVLDVTLIDANGQPVGGAELAVVVVDEAILALSGYSLADPLDAFYSDRPLDLFATYGRASIRLANPQALASDGADRMAMATTTAQDMAAPAAAPEMAMGGGVENEEKAMESDEAAQQPDIRVRSDFNPLAVFAPAVQTDANGQAQITISLPDNLTRYRVMVAAVDGGGKLFGAGEANMTARLPLMVRPSAPRFLNFGDTFELPVVLQNQTDDDMSVDVVARTANLSLTGPAGTRVTVPARDRIEVRFPAATALAGTARIQIAAVSGSWADAATVELPVYTPATTEAFATYGVVDEGAVAQPLEGPSGVIPQYGGLEISTSSTALHALTDAVLYLVSYPYECSEQLASRILAIAALRDVLTAFEAEGLPSPEAMEQSVDRDIAILKTIQNYDGGFPYWRRGEETSPFNTIHVTHALYRAQSKGFSVPSEMTQPAIEYLRQIESHYPSWYSQQTRWTLSAYALYVRDLMGDSDAPKALALIEEAGLERLSMDAVGWLWPVLQDGNATDLRLEEIRTLVNNRAVETAGAANFTTDYDDQNYLLLGSNRRTDAILLDALIDDNPDHDLITKVVNGLLAHRTRGRWDNTQENVFVLLALDRYFNTFEAQAPDFVARIWLGETYTGSHTYEGYSAERRETNVPMNYLVDQIPAGEAQDLILSKEGVGRLYYRLGLRYAPADLELDPLDMGFIVQRSYEAVDNDEDVRQDEDGAWHIKAGARVRIKLTMVADNRRYHVALVDPLPAGLEAINPALAVMGGLPPDPGSPEARSWWWWGPWYQHQNMRDERVEAFTTLLWDGVYEYSYVARATTPGRFIAPPAKAEEMYSPEVFGRSGSSVVIVE